MALVDIIQEIAKVITIKLVSSIVIGSVATYVLIDNHSKKTEEAPEPPPESNIAEEHTSKNLNKSRRPSSIASTDRTRSATQVTAYDKSNFIEPNIPDNTELQSNSTGNSSSYQSSFSNTPTNYPLMRQEAESDGAAPSKSNTKLTAAEQIFSGSGTIFTDDKKLENKKGSTPSESSSKNSPPSIPSTPSTASSTNSCSPNIVGGSFGNAIAVTLSCTYSSTIKYCLSSTSICCDPEAAGTTYGSQVAIGPQDGNYCLSYIGNSSTEGTSVVYQQNYTIDSTLPNLNVSHEKTFYQTTELVGTSFMTSTDFGTPNFAIGQVNLKTYDPSTDGLNCDEIIANYVMTLPSPASIETQSLFDVSGVPLSSQVIIPLSPDQLIYGDNFITSYIKNNSFAIPLYSCSTTKVNLNDFEYFQADVSQSEPIVNSVVEFEGGFSSYGFFEANADVYRGPAGVSTAGQAGENLKSGMYGILY